jgi:predicted alpha-1,2-mannosidase
MHTRIFYVAVFLLTAAGVISCTRTEDREPVSEYVDMFIGTARQGHTIISSARPFAMVKPGPDTEIRRNYLHAKTIRGFSQLHISGTGGNAQSACPAIMPVTGALKVDTGDYASAFSPLEAEVRPGYFAMMLDDYSIGVEATSTDRVAYYQVAFPEADSARILLNVSHAFNPYRGGEITILDDHTVVGTGKYNGYHGSDFDIAFYLQFSKPFLSSSGTWHGSQKNYGSRTETDPDGGASLGAFLNFGPSGGETLGVKVGISYVDIEGARKNMEHEIPGWDFQAVVAESAAQWEDLLSKIRIKGGPEGHKTVFYTSLYHAMLSPSILSDVDGRYEGFDGKVHQADGFTYYGEFSLWDTYRTVHPLYVLLQPERQRDMVESLVKVAEQGGWLPKWGWSEGYTGGMLGDHAVSLILDSYVKGIRDFDVEGAYRAMYKNATEKIEGVPWGRRGLYKYMKYQFAPEDAGYMKSKVADTHEYGPGGAKSRQYYPEISGSVSATLEFSYNDWCVSEMASLLGNAADADAFRKRAYYYKNVYDPSVDFMRPRNSDGSWAMDPFVPTISGQHSQFYCEGNAWTYSWTVPQDVKGLINLMGGNERFNTKLDQAFDGLLEKESYYDPTNEPDIHYPYLYSYSGTPWKTQKIVRQILTHFFSNDREEGLPGDDDVGTMSAWYLFSAMGFYPVTPGTDQYVLGSPLFDEVTIQLDSAYYNGKTIRITSENNNATNMYVQAVRLDGVPLEKLFVTHSDLVDRGGLHFVMGDTPAELADTHAVPYSMSKEEPRIVVESVSAPAEADANSRINVEVVLTNSGDPGTKDLAVYLSDRNAHYKKGNLMIEDRVVLDRGETKKLVVDIPVYFHGDNILQADSVRTKVSVRRPDWDALGAAQ